VRIYRRDPQNPEHVAGVVESVDLDQNQVFHSVTELLQLLALGSASPLPAGVAPGGAQKKRRSRDSGNRFAGRRVLSK